MLANPPPRVLLDADASMPPELAERHGILLAPPDPPVLLLREPVPRLALEAGRVDADAAVDAARTAADAGARELVYVTLGDEYGHAPDGAERVREAVEGRAVLHAVESGQPLMAAGWAAVAAAEALAHGLDAARAAEVARQVASRAQVMVYLEHPEIASIAAAETHGQAVPVLVRARGAGFDLLALPRRREAGLAALRDGFTSEARDGERLRVAVHHAGAAPAAEALATWARRHLAGAEVVVAPLTRHAATRFGPGMVGVAWVSG